MKKIVLSNSHDETFSLAKRLGGNSRRGDIFALNGDLGTGKTVIAQGIASGLNINEDITSPTFTLLEIYEGDIPFYHFDLYRIRSEYELDLLFFEEYWEGNGICVIEWAEKAAGRIPRQATVISIEAVNWEKRRITIEYFNDRHGI